MIASYLDSTNLKPEARENDIRLLCEKAISYGIAAVCIHPCRVALVSQILANSPVKTCTVIGFPLGADLLTTKFCAAREALLQGAGELDMVINIGALKDGNYAQVRGEIEKVLSLKNEFPFLLKVIVETALLSKQELADITRLLCETGVDFIKTSTGFSIRGVNMEDIQVIQSHKNDRLMIKASGGVKNLDFALELIDAGVDRIGSSNAAALVEEYRSRGGL